ncbi:MAG: hypothetical protein A2Y76_09730 [Planctomycetes bacterium RBG_13_60_9]|nr:MAG: hypothetical protein A2Y76_09730 [Planctomycetes bacterium RBG_13_60_9]
MMPKRQTTIDECKRAKNTVMSRRLAMGSSGLAVLGLLSGSTLSQAEEKDADRKGSDTKLSPQMRERMERSRAFSERMRNAESMEERMKLMEEQRAWQHRQGVEELKEQLGISDQEWPVVKPRIETVYNLVHPVVQMRRGNAQPTTEIEQRSRDLRELLRDEKAPADQIKAKLTAYRAAKEKAAQELIRARQSLRRLMTLRQEAVLVLNGLLD